MGYNENPKLTMTNSGMVANTFHKIALTIFYFVHGGIKNVSLYTSCVQFGNIMLPKCYVIRMCRHMVLWSQVYKLAKLNLEMELHFFPEMGKDLFIFCSWNIYTLGFIDWNKNKLTKIYSIYLQLWGKESDTSARKLN